MDTEGPFAQGGAGEDAPSADVRLPRPVLTGVIVTTTRRPEPTQEERARRLARVLQAPYLPREQVRITSCLQGSAPHEGPRLVPLAEPAGQGRPYIGVLVVERERLVLHTPRGLLFYHPGMARRRLLRLREGGRDYLVTACDLRPGDRFCDATTGLAHDLLVAGYAVGAEGKAVGIESVPVLAVLVRDGLAHYPEEDAEFRAVMRRLHVANADHLDFLRKQKDGSWDVVYFDPMFADPVEAASEMAPVRAVADYTPLRMEAVVEAVRVARRRVVVKERQGSPLFHQLGCHDVVGGKGSKIAFGYICTQQPWHPPAWRTGTP